MEFKVGDIVYCESKLIGGLPSLFKITDFLDHDRIDVELESLGDWKLNREGSGMLEETVDYRKGYVFSWYTRDLVKPPLDNPLNRKLYPNREKWGGIFSATESCGKTKRGKP